MFETLVRPAQNPDVLPRRRVVSSQTTVDVQPGAITWGKSGALPTPVEVPVGELPTQYGLTIKKDKDFISTSMKTETIRVENPDDPNQFVMVQRINKITFKDKNPDKLAMYPGNPNSQKKISDPSNPRDGWTPNSSQYVPPAQELVPIEIDKSSYGIDWTQGGSA